MIKIILHASLNLFLFYTRSDKIHKKIIVIRHLQIMGCRHLCLKLSPLKEVLWMVIILSLLLLVSDVSSQIPK